MALCLALVKILLEGAICQVPIQVFRSLSGDAECGVQHMRSLFSRLVKNLVMRLQIPGCVHCSCEQSLGPQIGGHLRAQRSRILDIPVWPLVRAMFTKTSSRA